MSLLRLPIKPAKTEDHKYTWRVKSSGGVRVPGAI
ncbi:hypothetical protein CCACVL1_27950 [Corchorus capsularis]|uniref:Uncharacterized protein n=1 Tax=Corchorus capsularis TaxID=210143 RepID=A0A1R3G824_COCAP|nr:hypothetical protein CCACVL1_27950 [Corchorus capsularis]